MLDVKIETAGLEESIGIMLARLRRFPHAMANQMSDWQVEDMHRKKPATKKAVRAGTSTTLVRPHSLRTMKRSASYQRRQARRIVRLAAKSSARSRKRAAELFRRFQPRMSTRPILRSSLQTSLIDRMKDLLHNRIKWIKPAE